MDFSDVFTKMSMSLVTAVGVAFTTYIAKMKAGEEFSAKKFARTMLVGLGAGVLACSTGDVLTQANAAEYILQNAGVIAVADQFVKFIWRLFSKKEGG